MSQYTNVKRCWECGNHSPPFNVDKPFLYCPYCGVFYPI